MDGAREVGRGGEEVARLIDGEGVGGAVEARSVGIGLSSARPEGEIATHASVGRRGVLLADGDGVALQEVDAGVAGDEEGEEGRVGIDAHGAPVVRIGGREGVLGGLIDVGLDAAIDVPAALGRIGGHGVEVEVAEAVGGDGGAVVELLAVVEALVDARCAPVGSGLSSVSLLSLYASEVGPCRLGGHPHVAREDVGVALVGGDGGPCAAHLSDGDGRAFRSRIDEKNAVGRWRGERGHVDDMAEGRAPEGPRLAVLAVEAILSTLAPVARQADVGREGREGLEASRLLLPVGELYP